MMRSLFSAVSGLKAHQQRMDVIGNNIANVNTPGFKKSRVTFQDMLNQTIRGASRPVDGGRGGTNPMQVGLGVTIGSIDTIMSNASLQETGKMTDLGIDGEGFFILAEKEGGREFYTRVGSFDFDSNGNLISNLNGMHVLGWIADVDGKIDPESPLRIIKVNPSEAAPAKATTGMVLGGNLNALGLNSLKFPFPNGTSTDTFEVKDSSGNTAKLQVTFAPTSTLNEFTWTVTALSGATIKSGGSGTIKVGADRTVTNSNGSVTLTIAGTDYTISPPATGNFPENFVLGPGLSWGSDQIDSPTDLSAVTVSQIVYDSIGSKYRAVIKFTNRGNGEWDWNLKSLTDEKGNEVDSSGRSGSGILKFGNDGKVISGDTGTITFDPPDAYLTPVKITVDFSKVTQFASDYTVSVRSQDGYASGVLENLTIDHSGTIMGIFSNGTSRALAQVALERFTNSAGLAKSGNSLFTETSNSGRIGVKPPGTSGYGTIKPGSLEMSNVDLSSEFTDMIVTQRGFQANSRVITASDEMLQDLVNLKR